MEWQLLAMWLIVLTTMLWFVRDERRLVAVARASKPHYFVSRPYQHPRHFGPVTASVPMQLPRKQLPSSLLRTDRAYFDKLLSERTRR